MLKHCFAPALALMFSLFAQTADAFIDPPYLTPEDPVSGETVSVNIRGGICDAILGLSGWPQISQEGNAIRVLFWGVRNSDPILCNYSVGTGIYAVGSYTAGLYTLQADLRYFDDMGETVEETLGIIPFTVTGSATPAVSAPALRDEGLGILVLGFGGFALWALRSRRPGLLLAVMLVLPLGVRAQDAPRNRVIELLVTTAPGAPTPEQLVAYYQHPDGPPPLEGLRAENPLTVQFLLSQRAEGDFLARLREHQESARAKLERYVLVVYPETADLERALAALRADPYVAKAYEPVPTELSSTTLTLFDVDSEDPSIDGQYGRPALNIDAAWQITGGGYALVADIDSGLSTTHASLQQFDGTQYVGGNFMPVYSLDIGGTGVPGIPDDANVDEREPVWITDSACSPGGPSYMASIFAGHGTHTAGLIAANGTAGIGVPGTCKKCGLSAWKVAYTVCKPTSGDVVLNYNPTANAAALSYVGDYGTQIVNMSFGGDRIANLCGQGNFPYAYDGAMCDAIAEASYKEIAMVAASGNHRKRVQFPASDARVIAVGGFQQSLALWDESPGNNLNCPPLNPPGTECGSNYSTPAIGPKQELMGSSKWVLSTTYAGFNWNPYVDCGDGFPGPGWGNGVGWCTGTSMSAPQIAGLVGLLRSINPLVPVGKPTFNPNIDPAATLRYVLASTTFQAQSGQAWTPTFGYGRPDAAAAARKLIGKVAGVTIRNRATPLFRLYSLAAKDYVDTTSPQAAFALMFNQKAGWQPAANATLVPGYAQFPHDPADGNFAAPRAAVYVMTTEVQPRAEWPALIPLHLMDKLTPSRDFLLVTTKTHIEQAYAAGYRLRSIQGYIYQPCTPEPACIPPGAQKFWRACKTADNDCATFLENERGAFEANGYTAAYPAGSNKRLGYAYPATDTDHDGLPDGFEYVAGTSPTLDNSDNDTTADAVEFPMVGVPVSDPCGGVGSAGARYCGANSIFKNAFDLP